MRFGIVIVTGEGKHETREVTLPQLVALIAAGMAAMVYWEYVNQQRDITE